MSGSWDGTVKVWDTLTAVASKTYTIFEGESRTPIWSVSSSPDSSKIAVGCGDCTVKLYDVHTDEKVGTFDVIGGAPSVRFSSDGNQVTCTSWTQAHVWDISLEANTASFECHSLTNAVAFSPDRTSVLSGSIDGLLKLWKVDASASPDQQASEVQGVEFSPDGKKLVWLTEDQDLYLWDATTAEHLCTFYRISDLTISTLAYSPNGLLIACGYFDGTVCIWDMTDGSMLSKMDGQYGRVYSLVFSPNCHQLVSVSDGIVVLWNITTQESAVGIKLAAVSQFPPESIPFDSVVFSSDGTNFTLEGGRQVLRRFIIGFIYAPVYQDGNEPIPSKTELTVYLGEETPAVDDHPPPLFHYPTEDWIVDREDRRVFWVPPDRRASSRAAFERKVVLGTRHGDLVMLDFSPTIVDQLIVF